ncbi:MAG TPA: peptidase MA family metallohydrolase [Elusimicrobiales bacterium]|nr:peptidase MA family metallohydrolase [Elusimicrobiales bacterium]
MRRGLLLAVLAPPLLSGCVSLPEDVLRQHLIEAPEPVSAPYAGLDPGAKSVETARFLVRAYDTGTAQAYASFCEDSYTRLTGDLGLYSFAPAAPYNIVVYRDREEYLAKTKQPEWSGGVAYGNAIHVYENEAAKGVIAHEIAHLVFREFMDRTDISGLVWLNEGIAVHAEKAALPASADVYASRVTRLVRPAPLSFTALSSMPPGQAQTGEAVERWYAQAGSLVTFMIRAGGNFNFYLFLRKLKDGLPPDSAAGEAFAGTWGDMAAADAAWRASL